MNTSPNDNKAYRTLCLDNGLRIVLVEAMDSHKSACSLVVNCGHFDDPVDRPGFAHFVEHLLFNGNAKYPEPNAINTFMSQHGGHCNAWTGTEHSCYFFDIQPDWFFEGENSANPLFTMVTSLIAVAPDSLRECHAEKEILLATGLVDPVPWTPDVLPLQLLKIGRLAVVALPSEITTMAGRRLMATVKAELADEVDHVVLSGLANTYAGYVATREEYAAQHYEGGHTIFGPHTLAGYQQEFTKLARAIRQNTQVDAGPALRELADQQLTFQTGVVLDNTPLFTSFGDVHQQVNSSYQKGQTAFVSFWTGHPKNDLKIQGTYLEVQRKVAGSWQKVADDNDWETFYRWKRIDPVWGSSRAEISWSIPADAPSGEYRIKHYGAYKNGWTGNIHTFTGKSKTFTVN